MNKAFLVILSCVCLVIYAGYLNNEFIFDDKTLVVDNPLIKSSRLLPNVFKTGIYDHWSGIQPYDRMYRPLQMLSYYLDYNLWGLKPLGFRLSNILLHLFNSILVFYLIGLLFKHKLLAVSAAILFLVHPVQISSVAYISARGDLLNAFFVLGCCVLFLKFLENKNYWLYFLSILASILALLSRENALFIVVSLSLISVVKGKVRFKYLSGFLVVTLVYPIIRFIIFGPSGLNTHTDYIRGALALANFLNIVWGYLLLLFWPVNLHMFHSTVFIKQLSVPILFLSITGLILAVAIILKWEKAKQLSPAASFGIFWFLSGIIPVYFYFDAYPALGKALMAESWLYLASIGFCTGLAYLCLLHKKGKLFILSFVLIFGSMVVANRVYWRNDVVFYKRTLKFLPEDSILLRNLASAYIESGDLSNGLEAIKKLERYYADTPVADMAYGQYYLAAGNPGEALKYYQRILKRNFFSNYSVSLCYAKLGNFDQAIGYSLESFNQNPFFQRNIIQLARLYERVGKKDQANRYLLLAGQLDPRGKYNLLK